MDLGFTRLEPARAEPIPPPPDYLHLIANLSATQAASRTAMIEARLSATDFDDALRIAALVELLTAGTRWIAAARVLHGCFHSAVAAKRGSPP